MSEDSISFTEDKDNLLYISKKINVDEFGLVEEGSFVTSISPSISEISVKPIGSEIHILENYDVPPASFSDPQIARRFKSFNLKWSYGMTANVGVINLSNDTRTDLFFASVHSAILYNYCTKKMRYLEGHQAVINCISSDANGDWLASSDGDGCLIVWCSKTMTPLYTLFNLYPGSGILLMAMSPCARYLLTIGQFGYVSYVIDMWLWTLGEEVSTDCYMVDKSNGAPVKICFNPDVEEHIMLVFENQVFLLTWNTQTNKFETSSVSHNISNRQKIGNLTSGTYMKECHSCFASSSKGCILVFGNTLYVRSYQEAELNNSKMYINAIKVTPASIGVITTTEGKVVVGDSRGHVLFFDRSIKILYWIRNNLSAITSLSFALTPKIFRYENSKILIKEKPLDHSEHNMLDCDYSDIEEGISKLIDVPFDASLENNPFTVRDFFFSTTDCNIYAFDFIRNASTPLFSIADANISCIDAHDEMNYIVVGYENGRIALIDFEQKEQIASHFLPKTEETSIGGDIITCIKYSFESLHLVCGRANGEVWILEPVLLSPKTKTPFRYTKAKVVKIEFSLNSLQFAYFDTERTVLLFNYYPEKNSWEFQGKVKSHYDQIHDIRFFHNNGDNKTSLLYTIGADRYLVEYNNLEMRGDEKIEFGTTIRERIEQSAIPMNFTYYEKKTSRGNIGYVVFSDNKNKIKMLHLETKVPRSLVLAPSVGCFKDSLIRKMRVLPQHKSRYMIFISQKYLGLNLLPLDGNPYKHTGYLAHPKEVSDFVVSYDGLYAFTYGVEDRCILQWEIRPRSVELMALLGGIELEPYYCLLEGQKSGWLFHEIQDLFFYMQILQQENIDLPRRVSDSISLSDTPDLVRSCGFYPSHFEIEIMMIDIRYRDFDETGEIRDEITFVEFVKLFINHRPAYGYNLDQIKRNFDIVSLMADYPRKGRIESQDFVYLLQTMGEPSASLHSDLTTLMRIKGFGEHNYEFLPPEINTRFLYYEILGIDEKASDNSKLDVEIRESVEIDSEENWRT